MILGKYSFGIGDRFGKEGRAQLTAFVQARQAGFDITPVWNKSYREHSIVGTKPADVRVEADEATMALGWDKPYFVDADHVGLENVDGFIGASDFFTLDVADYISRPGSRPFVKGAEKADVEAFVRKHHSLVGKLQIEGIDKKFEVTKQQAIEIADKYLPAVRQAGKIYSYIKAARGPSQPGSAIPDDFVTEVSMDETDRPQTPAELLFILAALADEGVPAQTIAPKFSGRFNKGIDYVGDVGKFAEEFEADLAVAAYAVKQFGLPMNLKLSVHSGSDKFSIYEPMNKALKKFDAGIHVKTAGTTWLEELIGLAAAGGEGLEIAKEIYTQAFARIDELIKPYATVVDIDRARLPQPAMVLRWDSNAFVSALRHDQSCPSYNPHVRQLLHVGYKIAAEMGVRFLDALVRCQDVIGQGVTHNILQRHIKPLMTGCG